MAGTTAASIGACYLGESLIGRGAAAEDVAKIYSLGLTAGTAYTAYLFLRFGLGSNVSVIRPWAGQ